jgi:hypothetical protein
LQPNAVTHHNPYNITHYEPYRFTHLEPNQLGLAQAAAFELM